MKEKTIRFIRRTTPIIIRTALILLSVIGAVKMIFFGLEVDEEYAVVMSYRMATGDAMLLDMWEPHQTSGFVCALFIKIFLGIFGNSDYLVMYLRIVGVLLQFIVCTFVYYTIKKYYSRDLAFWAAMLSFNLLPKWIQIPEFSNILLWSSLCTLMCLLHFANRERGRYLWLVLSAIFYCCAVLAYPTCLLLLPIYLYGIRCQYPAQAVKNMAAFLGTCVAIGCMYIGYFLSYMTVEQFLFGIRQMSTDGYHDATLVQRLALYLNEIIEFLPQALLITGLAVLLLGLFYLLKLNKYVSDGKIVFVLLLIAISHIHQFFVWNSNNLYMNEPLLFFYFAFGAGIPFLRKNLLISRLLFWPTAVTVFSVLLITNTGISVTGAYLLPGIIASGILLWEYAKDKQMNSACIYILKTVGLLMIGLLIFAKGFLVCENGGYKGDIFFVKQKALEGPAKNIYCQYMEGHSYNVVAELVDGIAGEDDAVLYVGNHNLRYLLCDAAISAYSTISTPTFDERLLEYWEMHPERYPTIVIEESETGYLNSVKKFLTLSEPIAEYENIRIYQVLQ